MKKQELLPHLRNLSYEDKLDIIQFLAENLKSAQPRPASAPPPKPASAQSTASPPAPPKPAAPPPPPKPTTPDPLPTPSNPVSIPGLEPMTPSALGRTAPEKTMQLSVNDLIDLDEMDDDDGLVETLLQSSPKKWADSTVTSEEVAVSPPAQELPHLPASLVTPEEEPAQEGLQDADNIFEELVQELEGEEARLIETLGVVRRSFWKPLQDAFKALDTSHLQPLVNSMQLAPMRIAINDLAGAVLSALVRNYHDYLNAQLQEQGKDPTAHVELFITKQNQGQLLLELRTPFREYIERLERLDEARDALLEFMDQHPEHTQNQHHPLLAAELKQVLDQYEEAQGIEGAWRVMLQAIQDAHDPHTTQELHTWMETLEQFLSQLEHVYSAVLYRVLELWNEQLLAPAKQALGHTTP